jgi:hypothetical protein
MKSAGAWFSRQIKATERSMLGIMVSIDGARGHLSTYPCRKGGVMETFMSDFIVVSIL